MGRTGTSGREENAVWPTCFENLKVSWHVHELLTSSEFPKLMLSRSETHRRANDFCSQPYKLGLCEPQQIPKLFRDELFSCVYVLGGPGPAALSKYSRSVGFARGEVKRQGCQDFGTCGCWDSGSPGAFKASALPLSHT